MQDVSVEDIYKRIKPRKHYVSDLSLNGFKNMLWFKFVFGLKKSQTSFTLFSFVRNYGNES